jgi:phosphotransferase system, enzyme I, PtsP
MKIFVAGATGAVGLPLVRALCTLGQEVTGMTRAGPGVDRLRELGASASAADAFDRQAVRDAIAAAAPDVVIDQLTWLPADPANVIKRHYAEEEAEALETIAMVLAELVASGELVSPDEMRPIEGIGLLPLRLEGIALHKGLASGQAVLHEPRILLSQTVAEDPRQELERFRAAVAGMHNALDDMLAASDIADGGEHRDILESYRMFAADRGWLGRITEAINSGLTAEAAVLKVKNDTRARMGQIVDPYLRERLLDLDDLANRLIQYLAGNVISQSADLLFDDVVLFARTMGPAELLDYDRDRLRGLVLEEGSPTAHVAIVARALDIPVLGRVPNALSYVESGDGVIVDADHEQLFIRPAEDIQQIYSESMQVRAQRQAAFVATRGLPADSRDGVRISLNINAGLLIDMLHLVVQAPRKKPAWSSHPARTGWRGAI